MLKRTMVPVRAVAWAR
jgi:DNA repair exonuclease SbcCD ATPase subunit